MSGGSHIEYFRLQGARILLAPYEYDGLPDDETTWQHGLAPTLRALYVAEHGEGRTLYEVAHQLRMAADLFSTHLKDGEETTPRALKRIPAAATRERTPAVLRDIATYVERWSKIEGKLEAHPGPWELSHRFPRLKQVLTIYFGQDGLAYEGETEDMPEAEGVRTWINDDVHPNCVWELPGTVAECYEALALFTDEVSLDRFFTHLNMGSGYMPWLEFLPMFAQECINHMREHHPSRESLILP
ncbi:hypothetical protein [Streptomyces roseoverticillatus]|uniref:Uncharacterized protein n=1 Tax=Streptomyces roseoverticillatus TaxID=66429 RepID=A0ABV3IP13_9ACTN